MRVYILMLLAGLLCAPAIANDYCDDDSDNDPCSVTLCHVNEGNPHEITVSVPSVIEAHLAHGDYLGECDEEPEPEPECERAEDCTDQLFCTGVEQCLDGECWPGNLPCPEDEMCNEALELCEGPHPECERSVECNNGFFCDGREVCFEGECYPGFWPCALGQVCFEGTRECVTFTFDAGVDSGEPSEDAGNADAGADAGVVSDGGNDEETTLSGTSCLSCSSSNGEGLLALGVFLLALFLFRRRAVPALAVLMLLSATEAQAEGIDHFQAANNSSDFLVTDDAATLEEGQAAGWIVGDYVYSPLVVRNQDGEIVDVILRHQVRSQAMASFGLFNWLELGIGAPAYYLNGPSTSTLALGDPRVSAQFRLLPWTEGLVASLKLEADLPLARFNGIPLAAQVTGDPFPTVTPSVLLGFNHKWFKLGTEIGHTFRLPKDVAGMRIGSGISYSVGGQVALWPEVLYLTGDLYGDFNYPTPFLEDYFTERFATPMEFAGGMKLYLGDIVLVAGGGTGLVADYGTSAARLFVGVGWEPQPEPPHECPVCEPELVEVPVEKPQPEPEPEPEPEPQPAVQPEPEPKAKTVNSTLVILRPDRIEILDPIHFEFDSDVIKKESYIILENVAAVIKQNEEIRKVSIEGHTDNVGSYEYNDDLSKRRAESVKRHLIEEGGIEEERLVTKGFGEYKPLIENDTPKNRAINRRVEFIIVTRAVEVPVELEVED